MTYPKFPDNETPSAGELALEDRAALRRVAGLSTELSDISEVEYRQLLQPLPIGDQHGLVESVKGLELLQ